MKGILFSAMIWALGPLPAGAEETVQSDAPVSLRAMLAEARVEVAEIQKLQKSIGEWGEAVSASGAASSGDGACVQGSGALVNEIAKSAGSALARLEQAVASGNAPAAAREKNAIDVASQEAGDLARSAQRCAQAAGVVGDEGQVVVKGLVGDPNRDKQEPEVSELDLANDPSRVSPF